MTIPKGNLMEIRRLYLSGGMTGIPGKNFRAFREGSHALREKGYSVVNPWELDNADKVSTTYEEYMRRDIKALMTCDGIATLKGWRNSKGASLEVYLAKFLKMPVHTVDYWRNKCHI